MDRFQFVEKLVDQRDELNKELNKLKDEKNNAYSRSVTRFREVLKESDNLLDTITEAGSCSGGGGIMFTASTGYSEVSVERNELEKVTDQDIIDICFEIKSLENECTAVKRKTMDWKNEDFMKQIEILINN